MKLKLGQSLCLRVVIRVRFLVKKSERQRLPLKMATHKEIECGSTFLENKSHLWEKFGQNGGVELMQEGQSSLGEWLTSLFILSDIFLNKPNL